jgi:hypothetical protein
VSDSAESWKSAGMRRCQRLPVKVTHPGDPAELVRRLIKQRARPTHSKIGLNSPIRAESSSGASYRGDNADRERRSASAEPWWGISAGVELALSPASTAEAEMSFQRITLIRKD